MKLPDYLRDFSRGGGLMEILLGFLVSALASWFVELIFKLINRNK